MRRHAVSLSLVALLLAALALVAWLACSATNDTAPPSAPGTATEPEPTAGRRPRAHAPLTAPVPPRAVRVAVTSLDGKPIAGARVELVRGPDSDEWGDMDAMVFRPRAAAAPSERVLATDSAGGARFDDLPPGRWFVVAEAPGFGRHAIAGATTRESGSGVEAAVALAAGRPLVGTIAAPDGTPASGVALILSPNFMSTTWPSDAACLRTTSDADGRWRFDAVAPGEYDLWYVPREDVVVRAETLRSPAIDRVDIREVAGGVFEGTVCDAGTGEAIAGARVHLVVNDATNAPTSSTYDLDVAVCDARGRFSLRTWRPVCTPERVYVDHPRYAPVPLDAADLALNEFAEGQRVVLDLRVRRGVTLSGTVTGPDGPVVGYRVSALVEGEPLGGLPVPRSAITDTTGAYRIERLSPGEAALTVSPLDDAYWHSHHEAVTVVAAENVVHDIHLEPARLHVTGRVVDENGGIVDGAVVADEHGPRRVSARAGEDGRFALDVVFLGDHATLVVRADGFADRSLHPRGEDAALGDVKLERPEVATGVVRDADGNPVAGARLALTAGQVGQDVFIYAWAGQGETATGADGAFSIAIRSEEFMGVHAHALDGATSAGAEGRWGSIALPALRRVTGCVVDASTGAPLSGVRVIERIYQWTATGRLVGRTDDQGRFAVLYEPGRDDGLRFSADGRLDVDMDDATTGAGDVRVAMRPSLAIAGVVREADGTPATGVSVAASPIDPGGAGGGWWQRSVTDADGHFRIVGLSVGGYELTVEDRERKGVEARYEEGRGSAAAGANDVVILVTRKSPR